MSSLFFFYLSYNVMTNILLIIDFGTCHINKITDTIYNINPNLVTKIIQWDNFNSSIFEEHAILGIILSGSPAHLYELNCPLITNEIFNKRIPILGICYGMQFIVQCYGGTVCKMNTGEFGTYQVNLCATSKLFNNLNNSITVHMQHHDQVIDIPDTVKILGYTNNCIAAIEIVDQDNNIFIFGVQFHPEVNNNEDTLGENGKVIFSNFIELCKELKKNDK